MDAQTRVLFVILVLLITAIAIRYINGMRQAWEAKKREHIRIMLTPPDALVRVYMQRHWPGWSWKWTTVGPDGRPQLLVTRNWRNKHQWHLVQAKNIKL